MIVASKDKPNLQETRVRDEVTATQKQAAFSS